MPVPDFAPNEVLTASAMDRVGLWLIKSQTVGTSQNTVTVSDVFSADYNAYRIILAGGSCTATNPARLTLGATTTGYYYAGKARTYAGADLNIENNNVNGFWYAGESATNGMTGVIDVVNPYASDETYFTSVIAPVRTDGYWLSVGGYLNNTTSYTAFTIQFGATGQQTGGTIRVYGYRN